MKNFWQIITLLMAVALIILSFNFTQLAEQQSSANSTESVDVGEIVYNSITTRSSVRSYTNQKIDKPTMEKILRAGLSAPTAANKQPWEVIVVDDREILDKMPAIIPGAHMAAKAQSAIVVAGTPAKALLPDYWVQDCSALTENILLAAHGLGLGAVWCGAYPENGTGRVEKMSELLGLPEGTYALSIVVLGYPDSKPVIKDKWNEEKIHYNKF